MSDDNRLLESPGAEARSSHAPIVLTIRPAPRIVFSMSRYRWYAFTAPGAAFGPSGTESAR